MEEPNLHALAIDAIKDAILVVDATGEVELANPAAIALLELTRTRDASGAGRGAFEPRVVMELVRRAERARGPITAAPAEGDGGAVIDVQPLATGAGRRWMLRIGSPDALADEISAERAIADVAHEIKNPITAMLNALSILPVPPQDESSPAAHATRAARGAFERSVRRLARLVSGLLDLARLRDGALRLERTPIDALSLVTRVVDDFRSLHPDARDRIVCEAGEGIHTAFVDPDRVEQAMWNLLSNAIRFTPRDRTVVVRAVRAGIESMDEGLRLVPWETIGVPSFLRIDVEDSGLGMTPGTLESVFDRHADPGAGAGGAHLGLSITRALVEAHDGWMHVESRLGEGTLVSVFFPEDAHSAGVVSRVCRAEREARRRWLAHRATAVVVVAKTRSAFWTELISSWPMAAKLDPVAPVSPRDLVVWSLSDHIAVALVPLADGSADPARAIGSPGAVVGEGAWVMDGFVAGWCGDRDRVSFAQAFHRAASRMSRARSLATRIEGTAEYAVTGEEGAAPAAFES